MDASAIKFIGDLAIEANHANKLDTPTPAIVLGDEVVSLEHLQDGRSRFRGALKTNSLADFIGYAKRDHGRGPDDRAAVFVDSAKLAATAYFNLGDHQSPGHADHRAVLELEHTAAYRAVGQAHGLRADQRGMTEWLEEWAPHIEAFDENGAQMSALQAIVAVRSVKVKATAEGTTTVGSFAANRTALEDIEAKAAGGNPLPARIKFTFVPALGLAEQTADLRVYLSAKPEEKPTFAVKWIGREQVIEAIAQDFKRVLFDELADRALLTIGTFTP